MRTVSSTSLTIVLSCLVSLTAGTGQAANARGDFRMPIADAFTISGKGVVLTGHVTAGAAKAGDWVCVPIQGGARVGRQITGLEMLRELPELVEAGQNAGVMIEGVVASEIDTDGELVAGCADD